MCGRFVVDDTVWDEVEALIGWLDRTGQKSGDVYPSRQILILRGAKEERESGNLWHGAAGKELSKPAALGTEIAPYSVYWGYPGYGRGKLLINARCETVQERPTFRYDFDTRRCVIPARGFYEWNARKEKFYFTGEEPVLYLAGIYSNDPERECTTILTTQANTSMQPVHERMPLLVRKAEIGRWVKEKEWAAAFLKEAPPELKREKAGGYEQLSLF